MLLQSRCTFLYISIILIVAVSECSLFVLTADSQPNHNGELHHQQQQQPAVAQTQEEQPYEEISKQMDLLQMKIDEAQEMVSQLRVKLKQALGQRPYRVGQSQQQQDKIQAGSTQYSQPDAATAEHLDRHEPDHESDGEHEQATASLHNKRALDQPPQLSVQSSSGASSQEQADHTDSSNHKPDRSLELVADEDAIDEQADDRHHRPGDDSEMVVRSQHRPHDQSQPQQLEVVHSETHSQPEPEPHSELEQHQSETRANFESRPHLESASQHQLEAAQLVQESSPLAETHPKSELEPHPEPKTHPESQPHLEAVIQNPSESKLAHNYSPQPETPSHSEPEPHSDPQQIQPHPGQQSQSDHEHHSEAQKYNQPRPQPESQPQSQHESQPQPQQPPSQPPHEPDWSSPELEHNESDQPSPADDTSDGDEDESEDDYNYGDEHDEEVGEELTMNEPEQSPPGQSGQPPNSQTEQVQVGSELAFRQEPQAAHSENQDAKLSQLSETSDHKNDDEMYRGEHEQEPRIAQRAANYVDPNEPRHVGDAHEQAGDLQAEVKHEISAQMNPSQATDGQTNEHSDKMSHHHASGENKGEKVDVHAYGEHDHESATAASGLGERNSAARDSIYSPVSSQQTGQQERQETLTQQQPRHFEHHGQQSFGPGSKANLHYDRSGSNNNDNDDNESQYDWDQYLEGIPSQTVPVDTGAQAEPANHAAVSLGSSQVQVNQQPQPQRLFQPQNTYKQSTHQSFSPQSGEAVLSHGPGNTFERPVFGSIAQPGGGSSYGGPRSTSNDRQHSFMGRVNGVTRSASGRDLDVDRRITSGWLEKSGSRWRDFAKRVRNNGFVNGVIEKAKTHALPYLRSAGQGLMESASKSLERIRSHGAMTRRRLNVEQDGYHQPGGDTAARVHHGFHYPLRLSRAVPDRLGKLPEVPPVKI